MIRGHLSYTRVSTTLTDTTAGRGVVSPQVTAALIAAGLVAGAAYVAHARGRAAPLLDLSLMRLPCFGVALSAMMLFRIGIGAIPFLLPLMLQVGFGDSAAQSGMVTFASAAGALVMKPVAQCALRLFGFRDTLFWNGLISAAMIAVCAAFRPAWPAAAVYAALLIGGFFRSLQFTAYNTLAYGDVPRRRMSAATSLYTAGSSSRRRSASRQVPRHWRRRWPSSGTMRLGRRISAWRSWRCRCSPWPPRRWHC